MYIYNKFMAARDEDEEMADKEWGEDDDTGWALKDGNVWGFEQHGDSINNHPHRDEDEEMAQDEEKENQIMAEDEEIYNFPQEIYNSDAVKEFDQYVNFPYNDGKFTITFYTFSQEDYRHVKTKEHKITNKNIYDLEFNSEKYVNSIIAYINSDIINGYKILKNLDKNIEDVKHKIYNKYNCSCGTNDKNNLINKIKNLAAQANITEENIKVLRDINNEIYADIKTIDAYNILKEHIKQNYFTNKNFLISKDNKFIKEHVQDPGQDLGKSQYKVRDDKFITCKKTLYNIILVPKTEQHNQPVGGGKKRKSTRLTKIIRKHRAIIQRGGNKGKLKKGYRYSGKRLKNGKPEIIKVKAKKFKINQRGGNITFNDVIISRKYRGYKIIGDPSDNIDIENEWDTADLVQTGFVREIQEHDDTNNMCHWNKDFRLIKNKILNDAMKNIFIKFLRVYKKLDCTNIKVNGLDYFHIHALVRVHEKQNEPKKIYFQTHANEYPSVKRFFTKDNKGLPTFPPRWIIPLCFLVVFINFLDFLFLPPPFRIY